MTMRRRVSQQQIVDDARAYLRWHGPIGARRTVRELRDFWSRRRNAHRVAVLRQILLAIEALDRSPTLH